MIILKLQTLYIHFLTHILHTPQPQNWWKINECSTDCAVFAHAFASKSWTVLNFWRISVHRIRTRIFTQGPVLQPISHRKTVHSRHCTHAHVFFDADACICVKTHPVRIRLSYEKMLSCAGRRLRLLLAFLARCLPPLEIPRCCCLPTSTCTTLTADWLWETHWTWAASD